MQSAKYVYSSDGNYAVGMNHPVKQRTCTPHFFKKERGKWTLDIATMSKVLRFNAPMQWHFDMDKKVELMGAYEFAFAGLYYDKNGYPHIPKNKKSSSKKLKWGFTCSAYYNPQDPSKTIKCWIKWLQQEGAAKNNLGLVQRDKVLSAGEGASLINNISMDDFMDYMITIPSGKKAVVTVERDTGDVKLLRTITL